MADTPSYFLPFQFFGKMATSLFSAFTYNYATIISANIEAPNFRLVEMKGFVFFFILFYFYGSILDRSVENKIDIPNKDQVKYFFYF